MQPASENFVSLVKNRNGRKKYPRKNNNIETKKPFRQE
jgi:hypothetical protein